MIFKNLYLNLNSHKWLCLYTGLPIYRGWEVDNKKQRKRKNVFADKKEFWEQNRKQWKKIENY